MQDQTEAPQISAIPANDPCRHGGHDRFARRGYPALAPIAQDLGGERQVAHQEGLIALEARALRHLSRNDHVTDHTIAVALGAAGLAPTFAVLGPQWVGCGLHARGLAWLYGWPRRQAFEPGDLIPQELVLNPKRLVLGAQGLDGGCFRWINPPR